MADNVTLDAGSGGAVIATDDDATAHHQYVKVEFGADNTQTKVTSTTGLPVKVIEGVTPGTGTTDLGKAEDAAHASGDVGVMPLTVRQNTAASTSGADGDYQPLITDTNGRLHVLDQNSADIKTAVELLDNAMSGSEMQVDVVASLPAGTNAIGKLAANSGVDIGDVDVTSCDGIAAEAAALGNGILIQGDDGTDRKNINVDATTGDVQVDVTNTVTVDGSGVTQPVSGTVTANLSATDNAVLDQIELNTDPLLVIGGGTEATAQRVTIANDSSGVVSVDDNGGSLTIDGSVSITGAVDTELTTDDLDTGAGTDTRAVVGIAGTASGGAELIPGSATDGLLVNLGANNDVTVSGVATAANQLADGHNVTIDNASGGSAVNIQDGGNVISVDDGAGSLTVDGSITANLSATDNAVLDQIEVNTSYGDNTGGGTEAGSLRVTLANDSTGVVSVDDNGGSLTVDVGAALPAGSNAIGKLAANSGVDIGDVDVTSVAAGSNLIGDVGISGARTSGGTTLYKNIDVDETEDEIKATAGQVYWIHCMNLKASVLFLKFYNATAANVTVGTTVPDLTYPIPTQGDTNGAGFVLSIPNGIAFSTAITIACTTGVADNDSGAPGANECVVNLGYA